MSAEEAVTEALNPPVDQNAQAAEDAKKLLAELEGSAEVKPKETNGLESATNGDRKHEATSAEKKEASALEQNDRSERYDTSNRRDRRENGRGGRGGSYGGRGGSKNFRDNIKSDLTTQDVSDDPVAIRKQVEFYFSDSNLPMDKFLLGKVGGSKNNSVELSIIHSFKRMRHFQPFEAIINALKESSFLELTDDNTSVRRKEPLPEALNDGPDPTAVKVFEDKAMPRSVYVKGFGEEVPSTQFDIEAFFAPYGPTNAIRLRRSDTKLFKGSVFVEFEDEELQKKFLELDPKPKYKGKDLQIMSKKEYCDKKVDDIKSGKIKPNNKFERGSGSGHRDDRKGGRDFKRKRDDEDDRDWRERRDEDRKNGFRDDRRRGNRDSRDKGRRDFREREVEKDERGIPKVKASAEPDEKAKRDTGKAEALAKARAAVEAEKKKESEDAVDDVESTEQDGTKDVKPETANTVSESIKADAEVVGKKRGREDDDIEGEREAKKIDV